MEIITIISILSLLAVSIYTLYRQTVADRDRYREFVTSVLSSGLQEYRETLPEENEKQKLPVADIIQDINDVDEKILIKQLEKEYKIKE